MSTTETIQLQSIGHVPAKPAGDLNVGDVTVWNFGYTSEVTAIEDASPQFVNVTLTSTNHVGVRRMKRTRLVGVSLR